MRKAAMKKQLKPASMREGGYPLRPMGASIHVPMGSYGPLAQLAERPAHNGLVPGSSPRGTTKSIGGGANT